MSYEYQEISVEIVEETINADIATEEIAIYVESWFSYSDAEAVSAVNNDPDHGSSASHNYASSPADVGLGNVPNEDATNPANMDQSGAADSQVLTWNNTESRWEPQDAAETYTDSDAQAAVNADTDHGSTASHNYFSGAHADLSGIGTDDHHVKYTDAEAQSAINADTDHGSTAPHNYFSGDHADLSGIATDDHHTRYSDTEAVTAVKSTSWIQNDGLYIGTDQVRARDTGGLKLTDDGGNGLFVADGGNVGVGTLSPTDQFVLNNGTNDYFYTDKANSRVKVGLSTDHSIAKAFEIAGNINFDQVTAPNQDQLDNVVLTENLNQGTSLAAGIYYYSFGFLTQEGEAPASHSLNTPHITISAGSSVTISNIPISSDPRVTGRSIYRSDAGGSGGVHCDYMRDIPGNSSTQWTDNGHVQNDGVALYAAPNTTAGTFFVEGSKTMEVSSHNVSLGGRALDNVEGRFNVGIGNEAGRALTTGGQNTLVGGSAGADITSRDENVAVGWGALGGVDYKRNTALGKQAATYMAGNDNVTVGFQTGAGFGGSDNTMVGTEAGHIDYGFITVIGDHNIFIGRSTGRNAAEGASNNILIGKRLDLQTPAGSDQLSIANLLFGTGADGTGTNISSGNIGIRTPDQFGGGSGVIGLADAPTPPSSNPTGGGVLFSEAGALKWRGPSGTVTTIAPA